MTDLLPDMDLEQLSFYLHPLGFFYSHTPDRRRRVHAWIEGSAGRAANSRHTHSFCMRSRILLGSMDNRLFKFSESLDGDELEFMVSYQNDTSSLRETGRRGRLYVQSKFTSLAGSDYFLAADCIHEATATHLPCVTLVDIYEAGAPILVYGRNAAEPEFARRAASRTETTKILNVLRSRF